MNALWVKCTENNALCLGVFKIFLGILSVFRLVEKVHNSELQNYANYLNMLLSM